MKHLALFFVALLTAALVSAATYPLVICLGDQVTVGKNEPSYPQQLAAKLPGALVINAGVATEQSYNGEFRLRRMLHSLPPGQHPVVIIMYGINDARLPDPVIEIPALAIDVYAARLAAIVGLVQAAGGTAVLLTPTPMGPNFENANVGLYASKGVNFMLDRFAESARTVAGATGATLIDMNLIAKTDPGWTDALTNGIDPSSAGLTLISDAVYDVAKTIPLPTVSGGGGDVNRDGSVNTTDLFVLINYLFAGGALP